MTWNGRPRYPGEALGERRDHFSSFGAEGFGAQAQIPFDTAAAREGRPFRVCGLGTFLQNLMGIADPCVWFNKPILVPQTYQGRQQIAVWLTQGSPHPQQIAAQHGYPADLEFSHQVYGNAMGIPVPGWPRGRSATCLRALLPATTRPSGRPTGKQTQAQQANIPGAGSRRTRVPRRSRMRGDFGAQATIPFNKAAADAGQPFRFCLPPGVTASVGYSSSCVWFNKPMPVPPTPGRRPEIDVWVTQGSPPVQQTVAQHGYPADMSLNFVVYNNAVGFPGYNGWPEGYAISCLRGTVPYEMRPSGRPTNVTRPSGRPSGQPARRRRR